MASVKPQTRDNLIYLAVGISVAALVVADVLYSEKHGTKDVDAIEIRLSCCDQLGPVDVLCCRKIGTNVRHEETPLGFDWNSNLRIIYIRIY